MARTSTRAYSSRGMGEGPRAPNQKQWTEKKPPRMSEVVFSHLFEALKCNFIYKLSIRFNAKFRLPCLSKTISEMESKKNKVYIFIYKTLKESVYFQAGLAVLFPGMTLAEE